MKIKENLKKLLCKLLNIPYDDYLLTIEVAQEIKNSNIVLKDYEYQDYYIIKVQLNKLENYIDEGLTDEQRRELYVNIIGRLTMLLWT